MRTIQPIAFSVAVVLVACGHEEPPKSAYEQAPASTAAPATAQTAEEPNTAAINHEPTSTDVPHEGPNAGNPVGAENGAAEAQGMSAITDDQLMQIVHTANMGEVDQAKLALSKTSDARVRDLAQMMVRDHTQSDSKGAIVAKKDQLSLTPSPSSESLGNDIEAGSRTLRTEPAGMAFDKDYVDMQVREHQSLLDNLDQKLIPNAKSADVKAYLLQVRGAVASHLHHAQALKSELK